jgi:hypothetical protein
MSNCLLSTVYSLHDDILSTIEFEGFREELRQLSAKFATPPKAAGCGACLYDGATNQGFYPCQSVDHHAVLVGKHSLENDTVFKSAILNRVSNVWRNQQYGFLLWCKHDNNRECIPQGCTCNVHNDVHAVFEHANSPLGYNGLFPDVQMGSRVKTCGLAMPFPLLVTESETAAVNGDNIRQLASAAVLLWHHDQGGGGVNVQTDTPAYIWLVRALHRALDGRLNAITLKQFADACTNLSADRNVLSGLITFAERWQTVPWPDAFKSMSARGPDQAIQYLWHELCGQKNGAAALTTITAFVKQLTMLDVFSQRLIMHAERVGIPNTNAAVSELVSDVIRDHAYDMGKVFAGFASNKGAAGMQASWDNPLHAVSLAYMISNHADWTRGLNKYAKSLSTPIPFFARHGDYGTDIDTVKDELVKRHLAVQLNCHQDKVPPDLLNFISARFVEWCRMGGNNI